MLIISVVAGGFVAAAWFSSRSAGTAGTQAAGLRLADEQGITLQTLIVTAVLVLMAVAAGVVIVAITGSASDDLEESGNDLKGRCNEVEIFDPVVASRNERGTFFSAGNGRTFQSERIGCVPVCVWENRRSSDNVPDGGNLPGSTLDAGEVKLYRDSYPGFIQVGGPSRGVPGDFLLFSGAEGDVSWYGIEQGGDATARLYRTRTLQTEFLRMGGKVARVAVAPNQRECHTYDADGNVLLGP